MNVGINVVLAVSHMLAPDEIVQQRYQIVRPVGKGGSGAVYEAIDLRLGNRVALKQTAIPAEQSLNLLEREARLLARLRHPALPRVIDHFVEGRYQYLVMEFIGGDDLGTMLLQRNRLFEMHQVLRWADQLLGALEYLHRQNPPVLHRDIKPQNLKLTADGDVVLLDFGLAKGGSGGHTLHRTGESIFGYTPHYAPLEQINNTGTGPRSDLYSLAATLYHLLTGVQPPDALTRATAVLRRLPDPLISIRQLNAAIPESVGVILMQALALDPDERPVSAATMRAALAKAEAETNGAALSETPMYPVDADTLPAARFSDTVRYDAAIAQRLTPTTPSSDMSSALPAPQAAPRTMTTPKDETDRRPGRYAVLLARLRAVGFHGWSLLHRKVSALPHPWNRYALPAAMTLVVIMVLLSVVLAMSQTDTTAVAVNDASLPAPTLAPAPFVPTVLTPPDAFQHGAVSTVSASSVVQPVARRIIPAEVYTGALPITLTVEGDHLDEQYPFALESPEVGRLPLEMVSGDDTQVTLLLTALPSDFRGEATLMLVIDGAPQADVRLILRDFLERKAVSGVRREYRYMPQIGVDEAGAYTSLHTAPDAASNRFAVLRNDDVVEVLRADVPEWYEVRINASANALHVGAVGWIERWLIDDQNVPPLVFAGLLGQTPTDLAVRCGTQFRSSIYGSVEDRNGRGIAGATLIVTSADGRNQYTVRTRPNGTYDIGGLGCTTWIVRLTAIPDVSVFEANEVRVTNLNGGRYTAAEVRFRQQP
ncbi:protein kinase domain-containing protein [Roseiflexus castenholzii]|nr:protein kinase [Roseiflexus castenholzii]